MNFRVPLEGVAQLQPMEFRIVAVVQIGPDWAYVFAVGCNSMLATTTYIGNLPTLCIHNILVHALTGMSIC